MSTTTTAREAAADRAPVTPGRGLLVALLSAATFGTSGPLAASLLHLGWSPGAVVLVRIGGAALVLLAVAVVALRRWRPDRRAVVRIVAYGVVPVAGSQLCFFSAVQYLPVGVALLLEYLAPVLLVAARWARTRVAPRPAVLVGAGLALVGMALVLQLVGGPADAVRVDPRGLGWGLGAAVCLACYFVLSDHGSGPTPVPALAVLAGGTLVGALVLAAAGLARVVPLRVADGSVELGGLALAWWVPLTALVGVSTVAAYLTGVLAVRRLGSEKASFVALTEVLFAVVVAAALLGQSPAPVQLLGGVVVLAGIVVVQRAGGAAGSRRTRALARRTGLD